MPPRGQPGRHDAHREMTCYEMVRSKAFSKKHKKKPRSRANPSGILVFQGGRRARGGTPRGRRENKQKQNKTKQNTQE